MSIENLNKQSQSNLESWLSASIDPQSLARIEYLQKNDPKTLQECFSSQLEFGTGGLRGLVDVGTNRMNIYTVSLTTQGICNYLKKVKSDKPLKVVIAYDSRVSSYEFACQAAKVFAGNQIKTLIFKELRPLPLLSFTCREESCDLAVMITASHNPSAYNGYKVFWEDGGQVLPPHDKEIMKHNNSIKNFSEIKEAELSSHFIEWIQQELDKKYIAATKNLSFMTSEKQSQAKLLKVIYSPLHGTGATLVPAILEQRGFSNFSWVEEQRQPDGLFPTVSCPNPEEDQALKIGVTQLEKEASHGDILIATDPDADRLAVVVKHHDSCIKLTGNESASIMTHYILSSLAKQKRLPHNSAVIKSLVTTDLIPAICKEFGVACFSLLTGFKYIGQKMTQWEKDHKHYFLFGAEESYGYLFGQHIRDKDAVICSALMAEIALEMKLQGKTLIDQLDELYETYGLYQHKLFNLKLATGSEGEAKKSAIMHKLRSSCPNRLANESMATLFDYKNSTAYDMKTQEISSLSLPTSDMLRLEFESGTSVVVRPSGTEPKLKFYFSILKKDADSVKTGKLKSHEEIEMLWQALTSYLEIT